MTFTAERRNLLLLHRIDELSDAGIAKRLGISEKIIEMRLSQVTKRLAALAY